MRPATALAACNARLELLAGVVGGCGLGARGVSAEAVCDFVVPFCDSASEKIREAAMGLLARVHAPRCGRRRRRVMTRTQAASWQRRPHARGPHTARGALTPAVMRGGPLGCGAELRPRGWALQCEATKVGP